MRAHLLTLSLAAAVFVIACPAPQAATLVGEVKFAGEKPAMNAVKVSKDQDYCGASVPNETYLIDTDRGLKNAVVFLEAAPASGGADTQKVNLIENNGCRYEPRVLAMQRGERLKITNADPKLHIPHAYLDKKTVFMLSLPFKHTTLEATQRIRAPGILNIVCDTHAWMLAFLHVFDHPYFAVSDDRGRFTIPHVPPGQYTLKAWHEAAGTLAQEITVSETMDPHVYFEFSKK